MLLFHRKKFIFYHIPKNAGSSVEAMLRPWSNYPRAHLYNYLIDYLGRRPSLELFDMHISPLELRILRGKKWYKGYTEFAIVRYPWDWHVSQFSFHCQNSFAAYHNLFKKFSFDEYVDWAVQPDNIARARSRQKCFLSDQYGNILVDKVLKLESLESDLRCLLNDFAIDADLPRKNSSSRERDYKTFYTDLSSKKIHDAFSEDIDYFGYSFG